MSERRAARRVHAGGLAALLLAEAPPAFGMSRCPPGTEGRPALGLLLLGAGVVLAVVVAWRGLPGAHREGRAGRLAGAGLDIAAGVACLAGGALGFFHFALGCFTR